MTDIMDQGIFPPVFEDEYDIRVVDDEGPRKLIAIHRPIGIMTTLDGVPCRFWVASFIARFYPVFDDIYIIPANKRGEPLVMQTWPLRELGQEIHDKVAKLFEPPIYV